MKELLFVNVSRNINFMLLQKKKKCKFERKKVSIFFSFESDHKVFFPHE